MARPERFERPTAWFVARYSIQLSYGRKRGAYYPDETASCQVLKCGNQFAKGLRWKPVKMILFLFKQLVRSICYLEWATKTAIRHICSRRLR